MKNTNLNDDTILNSFDVLSPKTLARHLDLFKILPVVEAVVHRALKQKTNGRREAKAVKKLLGLNGISRRNAKTKLAFRLQSPGGTNVTVLSTASRLASLITVQEHVVRDFFLGIKERDCHLSHSLAQALKS